MDRENGWLLLPRAVRAVPTDLAITALIVVLANAFIFLPVLTETPLRIGFGLIFVVFAPGYAVVATAFPEQGDPAADRETTMFFTQSGSPPRISGLERLALTVAFSILLVPVVVIGLNFTPYDVATGNVAVLLTVFTLGFLGAATKRRLAVEPDERFRVSIREWATGIPGGTVPGNRLDTTLTLLLAVAVLVVIGSLGFTVATAGPGERFTELSLSTEQNGELVANNYPSSFERGESEPLVVEVVNQEGRPTNYTLVVELQRHRWESDSNTSRIIEEQELRRFSVPSLSSGETWERRHNIQPTMTGERLRLTYLLYRGQPPEDPTTQNAYRRAQLWINVSA